MSLSFNTANTFLLTVLEDKRTAEPSNKQNFISAFKKEFRKVMLMMTNLAQM